VCDAADALGEHLMAATTPAHGATTEGGFRTLAHAVFIRESISFRPNYRVHPDAIIDRPSHVRGRPYVIVGGAITSRRSDRRFRIFLLRSVAEIEIANYLSPGTQKGMLRRGPSGGCATRFRSSIKTRRTPTRGNWRDACGTRRLAGAHASEK
jgi:hypothetical protein